MSTIIIAGTITVDPATVDTAIADAVVMMEATRAEDGCLAYVFSVDPLVPGMLVLFEKWTSEAALAAHLQSPHMAAFRSTMRAWGITGTEITRYTLASASPMR